MFVEISRNFRAGTLARSFGTQLARSSGNAAPRGSLFILLHAKASRGHPPWPCGRRGTFFEDFRPAGRFFSNQQISRLCRTLAGESRTGRFRCRAVLREIQEFSETLRLRKMVIVGESGIFGSACNFPKSDVYFLKRSKTGQRCIDT